jgi:glycosyltransferase involved in cell wall biosynthesis
MESPLPTVVLVIPAFNDARTLRALVERSLEAGFAAVMVVDAGSSDGLHETLAGLPVVRQTLPEDRGKGAAVLAGARLAGDLGYEAILVIDGDVAFEPADGWRLVEAARADWPAIAVAVQQPGMPGASDGGYCRRVSDFLVRLESGQSITDSNGWFRLYPVRFLVSRRFLARGSGFAAEAVVRGSWAGLPLLSVPVPLRFPPALQGPAPKGDWPRLCLLHSRLLLRSLLPWPHRRIVRRAAHGKPLLDILHPLRFFRQLSGEHNSPAELGAAVWVGIFIGALPIIPFGIVTIIYVNHKLHLNKLAGVGASNLCCAPFVPLLCIETGYFLRYGRFWSEFNRQTLLLEIHLRLWEWLLGALVVGPLLGLAGAFLTFCLVRSMREKRSGAVPAKEV